MTWCPHCNNLSAVCPTVGFGLTIENLIKVYNTFDLYAQYAICEGFGMPQIEAASCGVPVAATNYSAMEDVIRHTQGYPVPVKEILQGDGNKCRACLSRQRRHGRDYDGVLH